MALISNVPDYEGPSITLHSTWLGTIMSYLGAVLFVLFTMSLWAVGGAAGWIVGVLGVLSIWFLLVVLFDLPIASEFRRDGVVRRALLRHQFVEWDRITRVRRMRTGIWSRTNGRGGGLLAGIGRKTYMLVDTMESDVEFDDVRRVLGEEWSDALGLRDELRPPEGRSPTWLYRRDGWKPEHARKQR